MCSRFALAAFGFTLWACASSANDFSTVHPPAVHATASASFATTPYVDFQTRPDATNSHTFLEYGAQDSSGRPIERKTVGFYPRSGGAPRTSYWHRRNCRRGWPGRLLCQSTSSATFYRNLTAEQYERLTDYIESERAKPQIFNLIFNN